MTSKIFNRGIFTGWGSLVFFDAEEHQLRTDQIFAKIPKLGTQWKIIHEFKPTEYLQEVDPTIEPIGLCVEAGKQACSVLFIEFMLTNMRLAHFIDEGDNQTDYAPLICNQLPKVGEWTRIEISHEEVDGKYFLSFSVGGREVGRKEAGPDLKKLSDVKIAIGGSLPEFVQPGFLRRLVILEKQ